MKLVIEIAWLIICTIAIVPIVVLFVECCCALLPTRRLTTTISRPTIAVLVPAHNEAAGITPTLKTLLAELTTRDRLVVIADNCTDETASIARSLGVTTIERQDAQHRGKGYALDYGLKFLAADPPEVVVIIDADTDVEPGTIARIATLAKSYRRPIQATYLLETPPQQSSRDAVSAFATIVKNLVRPKGLAQLGLPCLLHGTGMAFPWSAIDKVSFASGNIVEDIQLALDFAVAGSPPLFCLDSKVTGVLPQQERAAKTQRTRWEHGHLQTLVTKVPQLFIASVRQRRWDLLAMSLDLSVPPLSLLVAIWLVVMSISICVGGWGFGWLPASLMALGGILLLLSIGLAWTKFGSQEISILSLLSVPFYVLWKLPIYFAFLIRPQRDWVRTKRDGN
jgi:cellulose synthase/poly-beta-1,6-N-acetylglucosamine synthase-like glycosyltransferase